MPTTLTTKHRMYNGLYLLTPMCIDCANKWDCVGTVLNVGTGESRADLGGREYSIHNIACPSFKGDCYWPSMVKAMVKHNNKAKARTAEAMGNSVGDMELLAMEMGINGLFSTVD